MKTLEFSGLRHYLRHYHIQKPLNLAACAIMRHYCAIIRSQYAHKRQPLCGACAPALRRIGYGGKARRPYSMRKATPASAHYCGFHRARVMFFLGGFLGGFLRRN